MPKFQVTGHNTQSQKMRSVTATSEKEAIAKAVKQNKWPPEGGPYHSYTVKQKR